MNYSYARRGSQLSNHASEVAMAEAKTKSHRAKLDDLHPDYRYIPIPEYPGDKGKEIIE
jgi:hypothetical protein